jgi:mRNA interferase RelE/StbE
MPEMYSVFIEKLAEKQLAKIPPPHFNRITKALQSLSTNPRPSGCKKLKGRDGYRIRVGDYRIIYTIEDDVLKVYVIDIGYRREIYR